MSKRILIVDDETNVRLSFRMALETDGYEIFEADSIEPAFEMLTEYSFALVILDLRMPGTDGLELLTKTSETGINVPVMIATAYGDIPHAVQAMKLGATRWLKSSKVIQMKIGPPPMSLLPISPPQNAVLSCMRSPRPGCI
jgi:DNA-binding NtrC family response regulator